ncbi:MAG TPA: substrate-binding domain-containing protein [Fimbriimonadaceae bacterium]|nr:substrate-binding domain-containing protein [Fimbriimonadaceae bacterium]
MVAFAALALAGCNSGSGETGSTSSTSGTASGKAGQSSGAGKDLKIVMIAKSNDNPVFQFAKLGAEKAAEDLSKETGTKISIDWQTPPKEDGQEQAKRIAAAVSGGANCVLISCSDASKVTGAINDAVDKGVQVMTFDSDAPDSKRFAFYGTNDIDCGHQVMAELAKQTGGMANYAILAGNQNAPNLKKRVQGVLDEAKKFPGMKFVTTANHTETPGDASAKVMEVMHANPQINAWAMVGGWPLFATSLLKDLPPNVKVVSVDALPAELAYVDKGIAPVLLAQPCFDWGKVSVGIIVDKMVKHKDVKPINDMQLVRVSKENLGDWAHTLQSWGATDVDPKFLALKK